MKLKKIFLLYCLYGLTLSLGYFFFGPLLIENIYKGKSLLVLNKIISGQREHTLDYYFRKADLLFLRLLLLPICSFVFYSFLYKIFKFLFRICEKQTCLFKNLKSESKKLVAKPKKIQSWEIIFIVICYSLLAVLYFYPSLKNFSSFLLGPPSDNMLQFWSFWWFRTALARKDISLSFSNYIFYPEGASLLFHTLSFYNLFLSLILRPFLNLIAIHNLLILSSFLLSGLGAFLLVRYLTNHFYLSLLSGFIFAFNPSHFAHAFYHIETVSIQFIPFFVLFFIKNIRTKSKKDLFFAILFFFLQSICSFYYLVFNTYLVILTLIFLRLRDKRFPIKYLLKLSLIPGVTILILSFWLIPMVAFGIKYPQVKSWGHNFYVTDLMALVIPHPYHWLASFRLIKQINLRFTGNDCEKIVYLGIVNLSIILFTLKKIIKKAAKYILFLLAFLILSMGPFLHIFGWVSPIFLPYGLIQFIPFLSAARVPARLIVYVYLFLAIIIAFALQELFHQYKSSYKKIILILAITLLIFLDYYSINHQETKVYLPQAYAVIKPEKEVFGILDLPDTIENSRYMMYQVFHGFPIVQGFIGINRKIGISLIDRLEQKDTKTQKKQLIDSKVKYIIIHKKLPNRGEPININLYKSTYQVIFEDEENLTLRVY